MRWTAGERSGNLEDRRGQRVGLGRLGLGGAIVVLVLGVIFGRDFTGLLGATPDSTGSAAPVETTPEEERMVDFVSFVLDSSQATWARVLPEQGRTRYEPARLVLFRDAVQSACGFAQAASGPFYCGQDEKVYVDLGFFEALSRQLGAPGDFAQAYVLAHEIGHHVQHLVGTAARAGGAGRSNAQSVRLELQADCYAGIWGHHAALQNMLESGDVEEGLNAAAAVGDDRVTQGRISPDAFTHGTAQQRATWFRRGLASGRMADCDTFSQP
jgi:hypothetical protein